MTAGAVARAFTLPLRWPRATFAVVLAISLLAAWSWRHVAFEPDVSRLLPADHPHVHVAAQLDDAARPSRSLWVLLRGERLAERIGEFATALRASPLVASVAATKTELAGGAVVKAPLVGLDDGALAELAAALSPAGIAAAVATLRADLADDPLAAREVALRDPLGVRWLLARHDPARQAGLRGDSEFALLGDGDAAVLRITGARDAYDAEFARAIVAHVERVLANVEHDLFGGYAVARSDEARIRADFERASLWSVLAVALYLVWTMRGVRLPLLVQLPAALSIAWAIPFACALLGPLPTVAVAAVAVLTGLGVDFAIHYAARYREERLQHGHAAAVARTQARTAPELLIDMATTAVTFVAIGFGQRGGLAAFGWLLALGLVCSVLLTTTVLPTLLAFVGDRRDPERSLLASAADRWLGTRAARPLAIAAIAVAGVVAIAVALRGVPLRADGEALRPAHDPVQAARGRIETALGFATTPGVVLWPLAQDASPLWQALHGLQQEGRIRFWSGLERAATAAGRAALADFRARTRDFPALAQAQFTAAGLDAEAFAPAVRELAASFARDGDAAASATTVPFAGVTQRVVTVWPAARLDDRAFAALAADVAARAGGAATLHGTPTITAALADMLRADLLRAVATAAALAWLMVTLWLRSVRAGMLALLPSLLGLVAMLGVLVAIELPLSLVSFVAVPFVLGIGVDEGVHMVGQFRHGARTTGATGVGVVRTSFGTALGFAALATASSPGLVELGVLVAGGSVMCMLACLFVLAPLLARRGTSNGARVSSAP